MTSLVIGGILASVIVIVVGILYTLPPYLKAIEAAQRIPSIMVSISIVSSENMPTWCTEVAQYLTRTSLKATVFFSGEIAEEYPDCLRSFGEDVDIGTSTYSFEKLSATRDYGERLEDVRKGKDTIDSLAGIDSKLFKAPLGYTDDDIYSLLSRNNITVDFSSDQSFNKYQGEHFVFYELRSFDLKNTSVQQAEFQFANKVADAIQVRVDNTIPVDQIIDLIEILTEKEEARFVNASELTGLPLTVRN
jgi:peptidoglycan/xylan/chitin deacetylase (PgdA/CDA1 family)